MSWPEHPSVQASERTADFPGMAADPVHDFASEAEPVHTPLPMDVPEGVTPPSHRGGARRPLIEVLVGLGYTTEEQVEIVQRTSRVAGRPAEQLLVEEGTGTADQLARAVAERYGLDHLDLTRFKVDMMAANAIPPELAKRHMMVPVNNEPDGSVLVAMVDPANVAAADDLAIRTGRRVRIAVASADDVTALIGRLNRLDAAVTEAVEEDEDLAPEQVTELAEGAVDTPVIKLVNPIIPQAVKQRSSDIHLEPDGKE